MNHSLKKAFTCFEDLSNEVVYEIFEFLDFYHIYQTFSNLNNRYYNLVNHSSLPIKINISTMSTSTFEYYYDYIIIPYQHRINSIYITNPFIFDLLSSPLHILSQFLRLETLILENIESKNLANILHQLTSLPNLSSLTIIPADNVYTKNTLYREIFCLPVLKYCKVSLKEPYFTKSLDITNNQYSPITHFVIDSDCHINYLNNLLSYLPQLRRLSCNNLFLLSNIQLTYMKPVILNNLTHLSFKTKDTNFDQIELFIINLIHQLQVFHFTTNYDIKYLDAKRWQRLILSNIPDLRIFDIELLPNYESNQVEFHVSINEFMSSFWFERQWFFRYEYENSLVSFYSIKPYRRKQYTLRNWLYQDTFSCKNKSNLYSVNHISIRDNIETKNNFIYFPNVTELTFFDYVNQSLHSMSTILDRIIPLTKLYKLSINCRHFCIGKLMELLYFSPNIHILAMNSISLSKISSTIIQQTQTFQTIFNENKIINITIKDNSKLEIITLFIKLCPRLEQLTIDISPFILTSVIKILLEQNNMSSRHLSFLCLLNANYALQTTIRQYLPSNHSIKFMSPNLYVWW